MVVNHPHSYQRETKEREENDKKEVIKMYLCPINSCTFSLNEKNSSLEVDHLKENHPHVYIHMSFLVLDA